MVRENAKNIHEKLSKENDPDVWERISYFTFEEVQDDVDLPNKTKLLSNLACLLGMQGVEEFCLMFPVALANGVSNLSFVDQTVSFGFLRLFQDDYPL